jgi:hypothetical protein
MSVTGILREPPLGQATVFSRQVFLGVALALFVSSHSALVLLYGFVGIRGNSLFSGCFLLAVTCAIFLLSERQRFSLHLPDYLFAAFSFFVAASFTINNLSATAKEVDLFVLSLSTYPVFRALSQSDIKEARWSFLWTTGIVVTIGSIVTAVALVQQWDDPHGKPMVFGFDAAPTYFLASLGFLLLAFAAETSTARRVAIISASIFFPMALFAASMVRFVFIAIATALLVAAFLAEPKQRKFMALIIFAVLLSIAAGLAARLDKAKVFADYVFEENIITGEMTRPPSCNMHVNLNNSIATRKALSADALFLIPRSGALGSGLDSFMRLSCIKNSEVHNSILQAFVEFGWLGGFSFLLLIVVSVGMLLPIARQSRGKRFLFSCLPYVILLAIVYGRISQDMLLFALLGAANGLIETSGTALVLSDT